MFSLEELRKNAENYYSEVSYCVFCLKYHPAFHVHLRAKASLLKIVSVLSAEYLFTKALSYLLRWTYRFREKNHKKSYTLD